VTVDTKRAPRDILLMTGPHDLPDEVSDKSRGVALALATILGPFGAHRFYLNKTRSGVLMLLTLGGVGIWYLYDLILVASGSFRDAEGRLVSRWEPEQALPSERIPSVVLEELDALRTQVAELAERVDFTERLLASPRPDQERVRPSIPS
jgi:hypothetical protein